MNDIGFSTADQFAEALTFAISSTPVDLYDKTVDEIYQGLWERTTEQLRVDLNAPSRYEIPNHMNDFALIYTRLAGMFARDLLKKYDVVDLELGMQVVRYAAEFVHKQANQTSQALGLDLITGQRKTRRLQP